MKYAPETQEKFDQYAQILRIWQTRMNLVAPSTLNDVQTRHIDDSTQMAEYLPNDAKIIDLGSGAGFPAVVLAIMGWQVVAIESVGKKTAFLQNLKSELDLPNLIIVNDRVENYLQKNKNEKIVFTARAFAPLIKIFDYIALSRASAYLLKGSGIGAEIAIAKEKYNFDYKLFPSKTGDGFIVEIKKLHLRKKINN